MQFGVKIHDREVLASGTLVLGPDDKDMHFDLDGMVFLIRMIPTEAALQVRFVTGGPKLLRVELEGKFPELGAAWKIASIAQAGDRYVDLDLMIYSLSALRDVNRQVGFTFTAHPPTGGQIAGPDPMRMF
ncbi:MAG: hypothetical protein WA840_21225 [Caulobacteraceae bacterium]